MTGVLINYTVLISLVTLFSVVFSQGDYDHYFGDRHHNSGPSIPSIPEGVNQNTGPVLFPTSPGGDETSGVIVGASGYGFVPPRNSIGDVPHYGSIASGPSYSGFF
ncbi:uncharacterized protein LOC111872862 isoform X2 [Cryptotermes secundus]|uniref:uncharacterized protein LOC111872862 isoform X2 n=1 Tax=Cryptotermes secundus TaxID=105785 RepID=UPI000CD7DF1F|nr:uncharacterized protein LOC111872862 isoform X2 [Cryptotermes secundus]